MSTVSARDLRNRTAEVLERASNGEEVTVTVHGVPTARVVALSTTKKAYLTKAEFLALRPAIPDTTLAADLEMLGAYTTDDLGPIR